LWWGIATIEQDLGLLGESPVATTES
jgi:hypothetical protein